MKSVPIVGVVFVSSVAFAAPGEDDLPFWDCIDEDGKPYASYSPCDASDEGKKVIERENKKKLESKKAEYEEITRRNEQVLKENARIRRKNEEIERIVKMEKLAKEKKILEEQILANEREDRERERLRLEQERVRIEAEKARNPPTIIINNTIDRIY
ncbi:MAG: hypothetical protein HQM00_11710 [Magnetococcales bacterium]|nr:hypothetical protein [Magnetococcales bacterium]